MTRRQCLRESPFPDFTFPDPQGEGVCSPAAPCSPSVRAVGEGSSCPISKVGVQSLLRVGRVSLNEPSVGS